MTDNLVTVGEIHTGLLHQSSAVSPAAAAQLLRTVHGERVVRSDRPISHVSSPPTLTGVDCLLPTDNGARVHGVGTVTSHASITGGHIVQGTAYATVRRGASDRRRPWSHYLARPGTVETLTKLNIDAVVGGFLRSQRTPHQLDLEAIGQRAVDTVQQAKDLDHRSAVRLPRTRFRFVVSAADPRSHGTSPTITFSLVDDVTRTVHLDGGPATLDAQIELIGDVARHDWLLTAVLLVLERSRIGHDTRSLVLDRLKPGLDHLLHLWMPAARTDAALTEVWRALEERPGFSRQWQVNVDRIRDQVTLGWLESQGARPEEKVSADGA
jgi:hypothetical protein